MNQEQLAILNSLVTFAAENAPGGLKDREIEVAKIVGKWCREDAHKTHNYMVVDSDYNLQETLDKWAERGWRLVTVISRSFGRWYDLVLERPVEVTHSDD